MAWGDPTSLKFDTESISLMRKKLQKTAEELRNYKIKLIGEFEALKTSWNTPAGRKFIKEVIDIDWSNKVNKYINIINTVDELLKVAELDYKAVEEEARTLSF